MEKIKGFFLNIFGISEEKVKLVYEPGEPEDLTEEEYEEIIRKIIQKIKES